MPQIRSAAKRLRQNARRQKINRARRSAVKTEIRRFLDLITKKEGEKAREELKTIHSRLDRATARGGVKKNYASRQKSRLARKISALPAGK